MDREFNLDSRTAGSFKRPASNNDNRQMRDENLPSLSNSPDHPVNPIPIMPPPFDIEQIHGTFLNSPLKRQKSTDMEAKYDENNDFNLVAGNYSPEFKLRSAPRNTIKEDAGIETTNEPLETRFPAVSYESRPSSPLLASFDSPSSPSLRTQPSTKMSNSRITYYNGIDGKQYVKKDMIFKYELEADGDRQKYMFLDIFCDFRQAEIMHEFFSDKSVKFLKTNSDKDCHFHQEVTKIDLDNNEKNQQVRELHRQLCDLWEEGYLFIPDFRASNVGYKLVDGEKEYYCFDAGRRTETYDCADEFGDLVRLHLAEILPNDKNFNAVFNEIKDELRMTLENNKASIIQKIVENHRFERQQHSFQTFYHDHQDSIDFLDESKRPQHRQHFYFLNPAKTVFSHIIKTNDHYADAEKFISTVIDRLSMKLIID